MLVGQLSAALSAEPAAHRLGRWVDIKDARQKLELRPRDAEPADERRPAGTSTASAVANADGRRCSFDSVAYRAAQAAALDRETTHDILANSHWIPAKCC